MNGDIINIVPAETPYMVQGFLVEIYLWGIEVIKAIQKAQNPILTTVIKCITALGTEAFYIPLVLLIFWWISEKQGLRLGILIVVSAWINGVVKELLQQPRPYHLEPSLGLAFESSYGAPSGHAQMSICFWIFMAVWLTGALKEKTLSLNSQGEKKPDPGKILIWAVAVFFILLIGYSRLYLGVHFPTDLFAGWILGGIIMIIWYIPGQILEKHIISAGVRVQNITVALIALAMNGLHPQDRSLPALFLGICLGYTLMKSRFPFSPKEEVNGKKPGWQIMLFRCLTGFAGVAIIYMGLKLLLPGEGSLFSSIPAWGQDSPFYDLGRFIRYGLIGFWASAGAPYMFQCLNLSHNRTGPGGKDNIEQAPGEES